MQECILKLILNEDLYDDMTDNLLTFPQRKLDFLGHSVQAHTPSLENISEQVSGFKLQMVIEITTNEDEAKNICQYIKKQLNDADFETQLFPLINFDMC